MLVYAAFAPGQVGQSGLQKGSRQAPETQTLDSQPLVQAAAKAYRFSLLTLSVVLTVAALSTLVWDWSAGLATLAGGLIVWLPHLFMIGKVFGVSRRGVRSVSIGGLLTAEAIKLFFVAALFVIALSTLPADSVPQLFLGFVITLLINLTGLALLSSAIDATIQNSRTR